MANKAKVVIPVEVDKRSVSKFYKDLQKIGANVGKMSMGSGMSTTAMMKNVRKMQEATKNLGGAVSKAVTDDVKKMGRVVDELEDNAKQISELESRIATKSAAGVGTTGDQLKLNDLKKNAKTLSTSLANLNVKTKKSRETLTKTMKDDKKIRDLTKGKIKNLRAEATFSSTGKGYDSVKNISAGVSKALTTKGAGALGGAAQAAGGAAKLAAGAASRMGVPGMDKAIGLITKIGPAMSMAAGAITSFVQVLLAASDHMTELNKTLINGTSFLNDATGSSADYSAAINDLRRAAINSADALLEYGKTSKDTAAVINAYTRATTGSLIRTQATLSSMDGGITQFTERAVVYGAALNMEATAVADMMGKFTSEAGYAARDTQRLMNDIVFTVQNAGMPVDKFMNIFNKVIPDVDLFENRIENLVGTMKMLSKSMSPKDVERFMMAFKNMMSGRSFQQKLQTTLIVGKEKTAGVLTKGLESRMDVIARNTRGGSRLTELMKKGEGGRKEFLRAVNDLKAKGELNATQFGESLKMFENYALASSKNTAKIATAVGGASDAEGFELMGLELGKFMGKGAAKKLVGIDEHIAEQRGYTKDQINAMRQYFSNMEASLQSWSDKTRTGSKAADAALLNMIRDRMPKAYAKAAAEGDAALTALMKKNVTLDMVKAAMATSDALVDPFANAQENAKIQAKATLSLSDKISNVIAFLLEKIYSVLEPILEAVNGIFALLDSDDKKDFLSIVSKTAAGKEAGMASVSAAEMEVRSREIASATQKGMTPQQVAQIMASQVDTTGSSAELMKPVIDAMVTKAQARITKGSARDWFRKDLEDFMAKGDFAGALKYMEEKAGVGEGAQFELLEALAYQTRWLQSSGRVKTAAKIKGSSARPEELVTDETSLLNRKLTASGKAVATAGDSQYQEGETISASAKRADEAKAHAEQRASAGAGAGSVPDPSSTAAVTAVTSTAQSSATAAEAQTTTAAAASATQASTEALAETAEANQRKVPAPIKTAWHKIITESVREGVEDPLVRHAMLLAKSQTDPAFAATLAAGIGGGGSYGFSGFKDISSAMDTMRGAGVSNEKMLATLKAGARTYNITINANNISDPKAFVDQMNKEIENKAQKGEPTS